MSKIFESIQVSDEVKRFVDHSFEVVNKIHEILERQGKTQRDLANLMGKNESEISKWMQGNHNFTLKSIAKIESVLGEKLFEVLKEDEVVVKKQIAIYHKNFIDQEELYFKRTEILNQCLTKTSEYLMVPEVANLLNQKSEIFAEEPSYAKAA